MANGQLKNPFQSFEPSLILFSTSWLSSKQILFILHLSINIYTFIANLISIIVACISDLKRCFPFKKLEASHTIQPLFLKEYGFVKPVSVSLIQHIWLAKYSQHLFSFIYFLHHFTRRTWTAYKIVSWISFFFGTITRFLKLFTFSGTKMSYLCWYGLFLVTLLIYFRKPTQLL